MNRRFKIEKEDVKRIGPTPGCRGCARALSTGKAVNHTEQCRDRFEEEFRKAGNAKLLRQAERMFIEPEDSGTASGSASCNQKPAKTPPMRSDEEDAAMDLDEEMEGGSSQGGWKMKIGC